MARICFVVGHFPLLSETFVLDQIVGLAARRFDVSVVCDHVHPSAGVDLGAEPLRTVLAKTRPRWVLDRAVQAVVHRTPTRLRGLASTMADLLSDGRLNEFDLLVAHFGWNGRRLAASRALGRLRRPLVTVLHGADVARPLHAGALGSAYAGLFRRAEMLLPVSEHFARALVRAGADPARVRVHRMGVDCGAIRFAPPSRCPEAGFRIISVCRLVEKKGIEHALRALGALPRRRPGLAWSYEVVGDGPLRAPLEALAHACGIADRVRFLGPLPHGVVKERLGGADAFLLPSVTGRDGDMEGVPVALMEAMAAGLPVVSSFHGGIPELVEHRVSGLLAPERDAEALGHHLEWLADDPEGCVRMARAARATIERCFYASALHDEFARLIRTLVEGEPARGGPRLVPGAARGSQA
jgi:colanic acid/amylovoran biosynthesis glycosyltransferase